MLQESIKKLVQYGIDTGLTPECERIYTTNLLLECMKEDEYTDPDCDLSNIVLETDSPYLTPHPFRGKKNSSKYLTYVAKKVEEVTKTSFKEVCDNTTNNASSLFDLDVK